MKPRSISRIGVLLSALYFYAGWTAAPAFAESRIRMWTNQTVYVPIYSHIELEGKNRQPLSLSATLFVRNTDADHTITITRVTYYDSEGKVLKEYLDSPKWLNPMASIYFAVKTVDTSEGWGANFIVEWKAADPVSEPVIEAVFIGTRGTHSYSFTSEGKAVKGIFAPR